MYADDGYAANSRKTSGRLTAILRSVIAALLGFLRPCSHSWSVRLDTPSKRAKSVCEKPAASRASTTGWMATL